MPQGGHSRHGWGSQPGVLDRNAAYTYPHFFFNVGGEIGRVLFIAAIFVCCAPGHWLGVPARTLLALADPALCHRGVASYWVIERIAAPHRSHTVLRQRRNCTAGFDEFPIGQDSDMTQIGPRWWPAAPPRDRYPEVR